MSKSIEIKKLCDSIRNFSECELDYGTLKTLKMIEDYSDNMSAEIEAQSKVGYAAQELLKDKNSEIARLKAELEDKNQQISDMRGCLHDYEEIMAELEKRPEVVRCWECKFYQLCYRNFALAKANEFSFCSNGQRKSEEGKQYASNNRILQQR